MFSVRAQTRFGLRVYLMVFAHGWAFVVDAHDELSPRARVIFLLSISLRCHNGYVRGFFLPFAFFTVAIRAHHIDDNDDARTREKTLCRPSPVSRPQTH